MARIGSQPDRARFDFSDPFSYSFFWANPAKPWLSYLGSFGPYDRRATRTNTGQDWKRPNSFNSRTILQLLNPES
jgi:hypothetical protein